MRMSNANIFNDVDGINNVLHLKKADKRNNKNPPILKTVAN